jgi:hypothetical protein
VFVVSEQEFDGVESDLVLLHIGIEQARVLCTVVDAVANKFVVKEQLISQYFSKVCKGQQFVDVGFVHSYKQELDIL